MKGRLDVLPAVGSTRFEYFRRALATRTARELESVTNDEVVADLEMKPARLEPLQTGHMRVAPKDG